MEAIVEREPMSKKRKFCAVELNSFRLVGKNRECVTMCKEMEGIGRHNAHYRVSGTQQTIRPLALILKSNCKILVRTIVTYSAPSLLLVRHDDVERKTVALLVCMHILWNLQFCIFLAIIQINCFYLKTP